MEALLKKSCTKCYVNLQIETLTWFYQNRNAHIYRLFSIIPQKFICRTFLSLPLSVSFFLLSPIFLKYDDKIVKVQGVVIMNIQENIVLCYKYFLLLFFFSRERAQKKSRLNNSPLSRNSIEDHFLLCKFIHKPLQCTLRIYYFS